jgi:hypothetical protein
MEKKEEKRRMALEVDSENVATPFVELSDGFMEQMELVVGSLGRISEEIWALVDGVKDLVEVRKRKELSETDRDQEVVEGGGSNIGGVGDRESGQRNRDRKDGRRK